MKPESYIGFNSCKHVYIWLDIIAALYLHFSPNKSINHVYFVLRVLTPPLRPTCQPVNALPSLNRAQIPPYPLT